MEPVRELQYGPAAPMAAAKAAQMSAPDYAQTGPKPPCFPEASTDEPSPAEHPGPIDHRL